MHEHLLIDVPLELRNWTTSICLAFDLDLFVTTFAIIPLFFLGVPIVCRVNAGLLVVIFISHKELGPVVSVDFNGSFWRLKLKKKIGTATTYPIILLKM